MERKTILIVEDDTSVREIIRDALQTEYNVLEASCCTETVKYLENPFDLAIIDYMLPDCDGFDMAGAIREKKPMLPIILMTAYDNDAVILRALRAGLTDYLKKPFSLKYLRRKVSKLLEGKTPKADSDNHVVEKRQEFIIDGLEEYIENNYMKDLTLDKISKMTGMSRSNFCRVFKERYKESFISYLNRIRIGKAAELLKNHDLRITDIGLFVGYKSIEYFERKFKALNDISPREYREKIRLNHLSSR